MLNRYRSTNAVLETAAKLFLLASVAVVQGYAWADPPKGSDDEGKSLALATGPLKTHPTNPRYFTDGSGKAIFLTGSHTWANLQDITYAKATSPPTFDFAAYLAFLKQHNHNFFRLWAWESPFNPNPKQSTTCYDPMPYQRPGPGKAADGKPKFDVKLFNQAYFDRMRARVQAARDEGMYVAVMLFQGFSIEGKGNLGGEPWSGHPFNPNNNVNGIDGGGPTHVHTLSNPALTAYQEAYIRKVIDTVNDLDNVLYESTNEDSGGPDNDAWQYHVIRFIQRYESTKPKQHPVGMTMQYPRGKDTTLLESPADWISPGAQFLPGDGRKVILNDTDHSYFWTGLKKDGVKAQRAWVWKNFTLGNQCLFMDPYLDPSHDPGRNDPAGGKPDPYWDPLRQAMGHTRAWATRMDLAAMAPHAELASTRYCLANPGNEYLLYLADGGETTVDLSKAAGSYRVTWVRPADATTTAGEPIEGGAKRTLKAPFSGDAVLYIQRQRPVPAFPLKTAEGGRYLVDQNGTPFLIAGESPQALMVNLTEKDAELFFANRVSHGFNAVWINLLCRKGTGGREDGSTHDGLLPFKKADDFATPNEAYFARCDRMIRIAEKHGLLVILDPCETIDHLKPMLKSGPDKCREFGRYLGSRYKEFDNLLWMHGNDFQTWKDPAHDAVVLAVARGIRDKDSRHLHTIELDYLVSGSLDDARWAPVIDVCASYTYYPTYAQVLKDYNRPNAKPVVMIESCYEFEQESTPAVLRRQEYWSILGGAAGQLYGNGYTWPFKPGWKDKLDTPGAVQMAYLQALFVPRAWHQLVPDQKHAVVIAGYGTFDAATTPGNAYGMTSDYVTAGRTPDGNLVMAFLPSLRTVTVDMTQLRAPATALWYDPSRGTFKTVEGSPLANSGKRKFTPPGKNADGDGDWVLLLECKLPSKDGGRR